MPVLFIMLDGLRPDAITPDHTPTLVDAMARGASTRTARSVFPSMTLPCHMSIFHSVPPQRHGILDNDYHSMVRPVRGLAAQLRTRDKRSAFFYNWENLRDLTRVGDLYYSYFADVFMQQEGDHLLTEAFLAQYPQLAPDFAFLYLGTVDSFGHAFGWMSDMYLAQARRLDGLVGRVLASLPQDVTVIIHSDHGGHERIHGTDSPEDMTIPYIMVGARVKAGFTFRQPVSLLDTAPTVAYLLGVPPASEWEGRALTEALT